ncbi:sulfatase-like hydrolase/transferase [bacterium]|nr:sulfatase-like hydrolase/transferase [bacterium]
MGLCKIQALQLTRQRHTRVLRYNRLKFETETGLGFVMFRYLLLLALLMTCEIRESCCEELRPPNVLLITVDDLRPELGCYGKSQVLSPHIDTLASSGMRFDHAYCQQAVCNPSRSSFLTGLRPEAIGVIGNHSHFRDQRPDVVTLPEHFKQHGYHSVAVGKIYHGVFPEGASSTKWDTMGDPQSWSEPAIRFGPRYYYTEEGVASAKQAFQRTYGVRDAESDDWAEKLVFGLATESPDVSDNTLYDGKVADVAIQKLKAFQKQTKPFFLAVGFIKPHSPYIAPKKYFDLYRDVSLAEQQELPTGAPPYAGHRSGELRRYSDQPRQGQIPRLNQQRVRHAYYACVSYIDAQVGRVLEALQAADLSNNTIVVLVGDHGYHLGEQGLWGKTTNFELDTRVPLIIRAPGVTTAGSSSKGLVELVDLFPTLAKLAGLPVPDQLASEGFVPTLRDPNQPTKAFALSQYPRGGGRMGYSMRNATHRLTQWVARDTGRLLDRELYGYSEGLVESQNVADLNPGLVASMLPTLLDEFGVKLVSTTELAAAQLDQEQGDDFTSFEKVAAGPFESLQTKLGMWVPATGRTIVDNKHAKSGKQCLQLTGGESTSVTLKVAENVDLSGELTFWAERWTSRSPFSFRIEKKTEKGWSVVYNGDRQVRVGRAFLSQVKVSLNDPDITHLRFQVKSPPDTGILIDDVRIAPAQQQVITSAEIVPVVLPALVGANASALVKIKVETTGSRNPISLTGVDAAVRGSAGSMDSVGVFATGDNARFRADVPFGKGVRIENVQEAGKKAGRATLPVGGSAQTVTNNIQFRGSHELVEGSNYFWLSCTLSPHADISRTVSGVCQSLGFSDGVRRQFNNEFQTQRMGVSLRTGGDDGVHTYRIPGLATTPKGTLIGVYDVRRRSGGDLPGDIDVGMSRSVDGGSTWEDMKVIMDMGDDPKWNHDGIGDPAVLVDDQTGTVWVAATWSHGNRSWRGSGQGLEPSETGQFMLVKSTDDGVTWSEPINITKQIKRPDWCFILQGPGKGITMQDGTLVFAAQYQDPPSKKRLPHSTIIFSKDHGVTWSVGTGAFDDTTESQVIEVEPGVLMLNCRYNRQGVRVVMTTSDMGATWQKHVTSQRSLVEPGACMASLIDVKTETGGESQDWLMFSNPDSSAGRHHITIKASADRGLTWPKQFRLLLDEEPSGGYSCMSMIDKDTIGILYEGSQAHMTFQRIDLRDVVGSEGISKKKISGSSDGSVGYPAKSGVLGSVQRTLINELVLPPVFGSHMVMQAGLELPIWGRASPGSPVEVLLGKEKKEVTAGSDGAWKTSFSPRDASFTPVQLLVRCGRESIQCKDVLFGEVWLCAGQSNMEWSVSNSTGGAGEIDPLQSQSLRLLHLVGGARGSSGEYGTEQLERLDPSRFAVGTWEHASTNSVDQFSAVAWFFAVELQKRLKVPVGVICPAVGGTPTESWVSRESLTSDPWLRGMVRGNWLDNERLSDFCRMRGEQNLLRAIQAGEFIPGDDLGLNHSFKPGFMWQASIEPLVPYAIRGVVWYQGESNAETLERAREQARLLPLLIREWRKAWGIGDFSFLFVQLPALNRPAWPLFREVQRRIQQKLTNVEMAVTIDVGHPSNVHPPEKRTVGQRLAGLALSKTYNVQRDLLYAGPVVSDVQSSGGAVVLTFKHVGQGLKASDGLPLRHFEVAGSDGRFFPTMANIDGKNRVKLISERVMNPQLVRYAWSPFPKSGVNFTNGIGIPASPFSTVSDEALFEQEATEKSIHLGSKKRPNVLLIISEDNGPELGCYGDRYARTPNLDHLASEGVRFETAYVTQAVCSSSRSSIFTGLYPHQNGQIGLATHKFAMYGNWPTTYSILHDAGYRTGLIGKTHVNPASVVEDHVDFRRITSSNFAKKNLADYARYASEFMNAADQPFFLTVNYPDAHWPLQDQVEGRPVVMSGASDVGPMTYIGFDNERLRGHLAGFYNCMARLDDCVGELLKALDDSGESENTLVIYIGDHGAQFARGKVFVTEGGLRIPMIVRWPKHAKRGLVSEQMVSTIDLLPTIVSAAGSEIPQGLPGKNLRGVLGGQVAPLRTHLFGERNCDSADLHFPQRAVRDKRFKLINTLLRDRPDPGAKKCLDNGASNFRGSPTHVDLKEADTRTRRIYDTWLNPPQYQLYDLDRDPDEFVNLADEPAFEAIKQGLIEKLEAWQRETHDRLRFPENLVRLTEENDACRREGIRSPVGGWQYGGYLGAADPSLIEKLGSE